MRYRITEQNALPYNMQNKMYIIIGNLHNAYLQIDVILMQ